MVNETLNPKLWSAENTLLPEVKTKLDEICTEFVRGLDEVGVPLHIVDIWIVGSNASYNYSVNSDLDVHLLVDSSRETCGAEILSVLYNYYKTSFNNKYDIKIRGIDVELYIEDSNSTTVSNGIYSLYYDTWVKIPNKNLIMVEVDQESLTKLYEQFLRLYNDVLSGQIDPEELLDRLYLLRKLDMQEQSEYGVRNLVFKQFRDEGKLDKLKEMCSEKVSKKLTLEKYYRR